MFMVGSFAGGLAEGLESGWKLGKDIQERIPLIAARDKARAELAKKPDTTLPALKGIAAEAPSAYTEPDPTGTGTSGGEPFDPNHRDAITPAKTEGGFVPKPATGFQPEVLARPPQPALPTAAPVAALPTTMPTPSVNETMGTPDQYVQPQQFLPGRGNSPMPAVVVPPATPTPRQQVQDWWKRNFAAPPIAPGTMVGGALPGRGNSGYRPPTPPSPVFTAPIPPPSSPTPSVQIDPRTGQPVQQAIPFTLAPY